MIVSVSGRGVILVESRNHPGGCNRPPCRLELCEVAVVIALHLLVEHLGLTLRAGLLEVGLEQVEDAVADVRELLCERGAVVSDGASTTR